VKLWKRLTLEGHRRKPEQASMSDSGLDEIGSGVFDRYGQDAAAAHAPSAGTKRYPDGKKSSIRRSLFRVRSRVGRGSDGHPLVPREDDTPGSHRRPSTYSHVHDAVMYNLSEAERSKHDQSVPMGVIGLRNLGNTCFINSSLQCLSATIPLTDYFLGYDYRSEINKDNFLGTGGKLVTAFAVLIKQMWLGQKSVVEPSDFKRQLSTFAPQFSGYHQHDSQELLACLLDGIHEDLNRVKERPYIEDKDCDGTQDENDAIEAWKNYLRRNKSLVVDLFQGQLRNTCSCLTCGHTNIRFEPFMYLSLPMTDKCRSLDDCLDLYLEEEILKGADQWYCEKCKAHVDATKRTDLWILPPILIVHLKRFRYNDYGKVGSKNDRPIKYPVRQWELNSRTRSKGGVYPIYDLYAVSNHMGGLGGGHYTALSLNRFDDAWYEFNDSSYRTVDKSIHKKHTKTAYVLFYNRSEGDISAPLSERSPLIRRQSVSRPDLWPHTQVDDRTRMRDFRRRKSMESKPLDSITVDSLWDKKDMNKSARPVPDVTKYANKKSDRKRVKNSRSPGASERADDEHSEVVRLAATRRTTKRDISGDTAPKQRQKKKKRSKKRPPDQEGRSGGNKDSR